MRPALSFDAGKAADPKDAQGTQALTLAMLKEGTARRTSIQIAEEQERLGANISVGASLDRTTVSLYAPSLQSTALTVGVLVSLYSVLPVFLAVSTGRMIDPAGAWRPLVWSAVALALGVCLPALWQGLAALYVMCAERVAIFKAASEGGRQFVAIAVVTTNGGAPCGACRQVISEFGLDTLVIIADGEGKVLQEAPIGELLPGAFRPEHLSQS